MFGLVPKQITVPLWGTLHVLVIMVTSGGPGVGTQSRVRVGQEHMWGRVRVSVTEMEDSGLGYPAA